MTFALLFTIAVIFCILIALIFEWLAPELVMMAGTMSLLLGGIFTPQNAFVGFSSPAIIALAALYVLTAALRQTGVLAALLSSLLSGCKTVSGAKKRLMVLILPLSAFLNNTPLVAMAMPLAAGWSRRTGHSTRALFMPMSYAAILGGTCTVLGTSSHLVTHGLLLDRGLPGLSVFELLPIGLSVCLVGLPVVSAMSRWILKDDQPLTEHRQSMGKEYTTDLCVADSSPLDGKTVENAGLRNLDGLFLVRII